MKRRQTMRQVGVGEMEDAGEFGLGVAPLESKPVNKIEISKEREEEISRMQQFSEYEETQEETLHEKEEQAMIQKMSRRHKQNADLR